MTGAQWPASSDPGAMGGAALTRTRASDRVLRLYLAGFWWREGDPRRGRMFDAAWHTETAVSLARRMYASGDCSAAPILADALQDAGCDNADVLDHCRDTRLAPAPPNGEPHTHRPTSPANTSAGAGWWIWCWGTDNRVARPRYSTRRQRNSSRRTRPGDNR